MRSGSSGQWRTYFTAICVHLLIVCHREALASDGQSATKVQQDVQPAPADPTGYFAPNSLHSTYNKRLTFNQYVAYSMRSLALVAGYDNDLHRYDDPQSLVDSFERNGTRQRGSMDEKEDVRLLASAKLDSSEFELLHQQSDSTLIENELTQAACARQLDFLYQRALELFKDYDSFAQSKRLDLIDFLDSFGAAPGEQLLMGNAQWLGSYQQCQRARVDMSPDSESRARGPPARDHELDIRGRYCIVKLRLPDWSSGKTEELAEAGEFIKLGVCLPQVCNSISFLRHSERLEALVRLARLQQVPYSSARLTQLYCLPDENSPLRQLSNSARAFLALVAGWSLLVLVASLKYQYNETRWQQLEPARDDQQLGVTFTASGATKPGESKLEQIFAFQNAWRKLFAGDQSSGQQTLRPIDATNRWADNGPSSVGVMRSDSIGDAFFVGGSRKANEKAKSIVMRMHLSRVPSEEASSGMATAAGQPTSSLKAVQIDERGVSNRRQLNAVDGIKVISMVWLISAHTMLFFIRSISNGRDFWSLILDFRFLTIMAGIFPVDSFFTITGLLTAYLKFNKRPREQARRSLLQLAYWLEIFVHRYLRFMPMYLLVFWYTRDVSEYIGRGPMWDYATASTSLRSVCKRESVLVPMLFQANFKPIDQHCVKPAWYLANDYQYLLVTPVFMLALLLTRWFGYILIAGSVLGSLIMQFLTVYQAGETGSRLAGGAHLSSSTFSDFAGLVNFRPMFAAYVLKDLWRLYVLPYNRAPPYLIGLITGHLMYKFNRRRAKARAHHLAAQENCPSPTLSTSSAESLSAFSSASSGVSSQEHNSSAHPDRRRRVQLPTATSPTSVAYQVRRRPGELALMLAFVKRGILNMNIWAPVCGLLAVIYLPLASSLLEPQAGENARIGASLIIATMRFVWSLSIARLIYVCFTNTAPKLAHEGRSQRADNSSFVIDLLSSSIWQPWSKIGLSVLLIQWEVIGYVAQIQTTQPFMSISFMLAMVFICIIGSYLLGLLIYLTLEFPLAQIELLYIRPKLFGRKK